jgi:hypothetical protein
MLSTEHRETILEVLREAALQTQDLQRLLHLTEIIVFLEEEEMSTWVGEEGLFWKEDDAPVEGVLHNTPPVKGVLREIRRNEDGYFVFVREADDSLWDYCVLATEGQEGVE